MLQKCLDLTHANCARKTSLVTLICQVTYEKHMKKDFDVKSVGNAMEEAAISENILKLFIGKSAISSNFHH